MLVNSFLIAYIAIFVIFPVIRAASFWIHNHHRIIVTIRKHIKTKQTRSRADIPIRIEESSPLGVVVSALEVVESGFGIVIVAAVAERVIIGIGADFLSVGIVYANDVSLQVLFKPISAERSLSHADIPALHPDRASIRIVQIQAQNILPLLRDDL